MPAQLGFCQASPMKKLTTIPEPEIPGTLQFQLSLLRLAEIADTDRGAKPETTHTTELEQLLEKVPVRKQPTNKELE